MISAPAAGSVISTGANVTITASAADSDGTIVKVEFFSGGALIGTATSAPYDFTWPNPGPGSYSLAALAAEGEEEEA